jgi:uroporphyrin-III C-methyltransferase/precorrin-2 dehydrogenase/sirohydrochlorin ferrochelatase
LDHLPVSLDLKRRWALLVGGGAVALRKAELLLSAGARLLVVAPEILPELARRADRVDERPFEPGDLDGMALVVAATDDREINRAVAEAAASRQLPVNVVDDPELCSFIMPAIVERGRVTIAISTGGASPVLARLLRARLEALLPPGLAALAERALAWRSRVKAALSDPAARRHFWNRALDRHDEPDLEALLAEPLDKASGVEIIAVDPADPEATPLRALRRIAAADLVLHHPAVPPRLLAFARRDAELRASLDPAGEAGPDPARRVVALVVVEF